MSNIIKKRELITRVADSLETTKKDATEILESVFGVLEDVLISDQLGVKLGEIGTLKVEVVPERTHWNLQTGGTVVKPTHYSLKFKASKPFKDELAQVEVSV